MHETVPVWQDHGASLDPRHVALTERSIPMSGNPLGELRLRPTELAAACLDGVSE
jgi:hypothetical protein